MYPVLTMLHLEYSVQRGARYKQGTGKLEQVQQRPLLWLGTGQERLRELGLCPVRKKDCGGLNFGPLFPEAGLERRWSPGKKGKKALAGVGG